MYILYIWGLYDFYLQSISETLVPEVSIHNQMFYINNSTLMEYMPNPDLNKDQSMQFSGKYICK